MAGRLGWYLLIVVLATGLGGWFGFRNVSEICAALDRHNVDYTDCDLGPIYAFMWGWQAAVVALVVVAATEVAIRLSSATADRAA